VIRVLDRNFSARSEDVFLKLSHYVQREQGFRCQVSGVRTDGDVRFWGFRRDAMATKDFLDVECPQGWPIAEE
jgi:hypothetical protein